MVTKWTSWPYPTTCGILPFDPVTVFSGPTDAELGTSSAETALREFLQRGDLPWVQQKYWRLLAEDSSRAEFAHGRLSAELEWLLFERVKGQWKWTSYSSNCKPTSIAGRGAVVNWTIAERGRYPLKPGTRRVHVGLSGGPCDGGRAENPHAHALFKTIQRKLLMTIWLDPVPPGNYTCPALIEPPLVVRLPARLGSRTLYDGSTYPPIAAGKTPSRFE